MVINDLQRFNEFADSIGNRYDAVIILSQWARDLGHKFSEYRISESKLINNVLTGRCFYSDDEMYNRKVNSDYDNLQEFLYNVLDNSIVEEVKKLYTLSIREHKLHFCDNSEFSKGKQAKINILLKMIWYSVN